MVSEQAAVSEHLEIRAIIDAFIQERLQAKLDKLKDDEEDKRQAAARRSASCADR